MLSPAAMRIVDWLGEVGSRWGLAPDACRVHGLLFLMARPVPQDAIESELNMASSQAGDALMWLAEERLATSGAEGWTTQADPWLLVMQALESRRARELAPARAVLATWRSPGSTEDPIVVRQARLLHDLVDDLAAIDAGARRLSPDAMRRMVSIGGRAARFVDKAFGRRSGS